MSVAAVSESTSSDFATAVRQHSWAWLVALQRRLGVDRLQILDERGRPLIPETATSPAAIARLPDVTSVVASAIHSRAPESVRLGQAQLTCVGLLASEGRGALLLARTVTDATAPEAKTELELIGSWLRPAVEAHIESASSDSTEHAPRVSALFRVLSGAASAGSESTLLRLFADAVAIWHDIELRAYVEDLEGTFRLAISLPGAPLADAPSRLDGNEMTIGSELMSVSGHDLEVLGLRVNDEPMAARIGDVKQGTVWLLVLLRGGNSLGEARLALYTDVLRQALQNVADASLLAVERRIWQHLVNANSQIQAAVEAALHEVEKSVGATTAALSVAVSQGAELVQIGDLALLADSDSDRLGLPRLTTTAHIDDRGTIVLTVQGPKGGFFTSRDRHIVDSIGQLFGSWASGMLQRTPTAFDRRAASRSFEDVLERTAEQAAARGTSTSVVVIHVKDAGPRLTQKVVAELRTHVRAGESVGVLDAGEIGLLLYDSSAEVARSVVGRLRRAVASGEGERPLATAAVGVAQCGPGSSPTIRLVRAAREDARNASRSPDTRATSS